MTKQNRLLAAVLIAWGCVAAAVPARADYIDALNAYQNGQYPQALREFRDLARTGHAGAEFMLGVMHFNGFGVSRDEVVAAIYFRQAAEQGEPGAQLAFGSIHIRGVGVYQDLVEARTWLRLCAHTTQPDLSKQAVALLDLTGPLMTPDEISRADRQAERWRPVRPGFARDPR